MPKVYYIYHIVAYFRPHLVMIPGYCDTSPRVRQGQGHNGFTFQSLGGLVHKDVREVSGQPHPGEDQRHRVGRDHHVGARHLLSGGQVERARLHRAEFTHRLRNRGDGTLLLIHPYHRYLVRVLGVKLVKVLRYIKIGSTKNIRK